MKKVFATVAVMMTLGSVYAQSSTEKNDTIVTDTTKTQPVEQIYMQRNDTVVTDTTKAEPVELAYIMQNDTIVTDTTKTETPVELAYATPNDTIVTDTVKNKVPETPCEKKRENIIQALNALKKSEA